MLLHRGGIHSGQGIQGPSDVQTGRGLPGLWFCKKQRIRNKRAYRSVIKAWMLRDTQAHFYQKLYTGGLTQKGLGRRPLQTNRNKGNKGEKAAAEYIAAMHCDILEKNYFTKDGEIDIIFKDEDTFVFAEVKFRLNEKFGKPAESVTPPKIKRICRTALHYLVENGLMNEKCRFDIMEVSGEQMTVRHIKNAFEALF